MRQAASLARYSTLNLPICHTVPTPESSPRDEKLDSIHSMRLLDLSGELLLCIAENLSSAKDILSLVLVRQSTSRLLLSALYKFNIQRQNSSALHWAARHRKPETADIIIHRHRSDVNAVYHTNTPLIYAASYGSESVVNVLLASPDISVNFRNQRGQCALRWAAFQGYANVVDLLLHQKDIQVDLPDREYGFSPLAAAVANEHETVVLRLLQTGQANVNAQDRWGRTPIFYSLSRQDQRTFKALLEDESLDLPCQDDRGRTPLIYGVSKRLTVLVEMILGHPSPHVNVRDIDDRSALWHAVRQGSHRTVQLLLECGSDANTADVYGVTSLNQSILEGSLAVAQLLLRYLGHNRSE